MTRVRARKGASVAERIELHVDRRDGCWIWVGRLNAAGYGRMIINHRDVLVHRASYEAHVGPIPDGLQLDHLCRNRACCNPDHLEPVTGHVNVHRSPLTFASRNAAKTHCPRNHEYTPENTYIHRYRGHVRRNCRTCAAAKQQRMSAAKRARASA